ncbi:hypothetical protein DFJ43DRAFT_1040626 [Lentinula guzmanii]|uniref:Uncharacterized protein n=1 Tax=Lentinula guzmanii TaxID=2804957 RepID=A0AA38JDL7_9AGAR|nr:hypothetical protein DFJ43DRAFT_1040626 [Lentinula guzmanii]
MSDLFRALSPATAAISASSHASSGAEAIQSSSFHLLSAAGSVQEVLALIPDSYRGVLTAPLHGTSLDLQLSGEFKTSAAGIDSSKSVQELSDKFRNDLFSQQIKAKKSEVALLRSKLVPETLFNEFRPVLEARFNELRASSKRADVIEVDALNAQQQVIGREIRLVGFTEAPELKGQFLDLLANIVQFALRVCLIVEAQHSRQEGKRREKRELKASVDVEMADITRSGPSLQSVIDKAVNAKVREALKGSKKKDSSSKKKTSGPKGGKGPKNSATAGVQVVRTPSATKGGKRVPKRQKAGKPSQPVASSSKAQGKRKA